MENNEDKKQLGLFMKAIKFCIKKLYYLRIIVTHIFMTIKHYSLIVIINM